MWETRRQGDLEAQREIGVTPKKLVCLLVEVFPVRCPERERESEPICLEVSSVHDWPVVHRT